MKAVYDFIFYVRCVLNNWALLLGWVVCIGSVYLLAAPVHASCGLTENTYRALVITVLLGAVVGLAKMGWGNGTIKSYYRTKEKLAENRAACSFTDKKTHGYCNRVGVRMALKDAGHKYVSKRRPWWKFKVV